MSTMNTKKILELLGTTPEKKLQTLEREEYFPVTGEASANEMLNADLYGRPAGKRSATEATKRPIAKKSASESTGTSKKDATEASGKVIASVPLPAEAKKKLMASKKKGQLSEVKEDIEDEIASEPVEEIPAETGEGTGDIVCMNINNKDDVSVAYLDYDPSELPQEVVDNISAAIADAGYSLVPSEDEGAEEVDEDESADEAAAAEGTKKPVFKKGGCTGKGCDDDATECDATEMVVETGEGKFPEEFDFDEEAFGEEYGIDPKEISCIYVEEDTEAKIPEHIEVSFTYEESNVVLNIYADSTVEETVDAQEVDPQFSVLFDKEEDEDGNERDVMKLDLVEDEDSGAVKSEGDDLTKSEGDEDHTDEDGADITDEFIEEHGLDMDDHYTRTHGLTRADKGYHEATQTYRPGTGREVYPSRESVGRKSAAKVAPAKKPVAKKQKSSKESLAAKVIRNRK